MTPPQPCDYAVLAFTPHFLPGYKAGGPVKSMRDIFDSLPEPHRILLVTGDRDLGDQRPYPGIQLDQPKQFGRHSVIYFGPQRARSWRILLAALRRRYEVLYLNSLWSPLFTLIPIVAHAIGFTKARSVLLAPRGETSASALDIKRFKKRLFLPVMTALLHLVDPIWQVSSEEESRDVRALFPKARTLVQPNSPGEPPARQILRSGPSPRLAFVGRIAPMKNLKFCLAALQGVSAPLIFDIYGPVEDAEYWASCRHEIARIPGNIQVRYRGPVASGETSNILKDYDALLMPTRGENFGHVISESMAAGCPVLCSDRTPWTGLIENGCGTVLDISEAHHWTRAIETLSRTSPEQRSIKKEKCLDVYTKWRADSQWISALDLILNDAPIAP